MSVIANRVKVATSTTGTGTIDLDDTAVTGFQTFADGGVTNGQVVSYAIEDGDAWEIGTGTYTTGTPNTLSRTVIESSNSDSEINLSGSALVFITALASELVLTANTQTLTNKTLTSPALTGTVLEDVYALTGTSVALEPDNGSIQSHTLTGNTTYTDGFAAGEAITLMIDDGTDYTITWPTITWVNNGGLAPTLATTGYTVVALWKVSTTLYGALVGNGT
jgi:hypothetical protein